VDEFIRNVKPYIFVREEDCLLIKRPNQAQRLNHQGVEVLRFLLDGGTAAELLKRAGSPERQDDIILFLYDIRRSLEGSLRADNRTCAVEVEPLAVNFSQLPVLSEVAVTSRCNLRCLFCYAGCACATRPGLGKAEMSTAQIERVLEKIFNEAKVPSVSFTGGEPLLREDIAGLVEYAANLGFRVNMITNGTMMTVSKARELATAGLASAQVSLEGTTAVTHEAITSVTGSFGRTVAAVEHLRDAGLVVHTNTTLNSINLDESIMMPRFVHEVLGLERFSMNMVIPSGSASVNEGLLLRYSEIGHQLKRIQGESHARGVDFMWYSPTPLCIFNPIIHGLGNKGCAACDGLLSVDPAGGVLPCSSLDDPVGNMLESGFTEIWQSRRARMYRLKELAHPVCHDCDNFNACHGACPLYWQHFGFGELEPIQREAGVALG
jgi:radical SAM protein with 4Fe4S-binding SPASM domain